MRHDSGRRRHSPMPGPNRDWDYCEIPFAGAKEEDWEIKIVGEETCEAASGHYSDQLWDETDWPAYTQQ